MQTCPSIRSDPRGGTTLIDLLAEDVQDYFLREGGCADPPPAQFAASPPPPSSKHPLPSKENIWRRPSLTSEGEQVRGQNTAESDRNVPNRRTQWQRRRGSGSGSLQSSLHRTLQSSGSGSFQSRGTDPSGGRSVGFAMSMCTADAEFLSRYHAEDSSRSSLVYNDCGGSRQGRVVSVSPESEERQSRNERSSSDSITMCYSLSYRKSASDQSDSSDDERRDIENLVKIDPSNNNSPGLYGIDLAPTHSSGCRSTEAGRGIKDDWLRAGADPRELWPFGEDESDGSESGQSSDSYYDCSFSSSGTSSEESRMISRTRWQRDLERTSRYKKDLKEARPRPVDVVNCGDPLLAKDDGHRPNYSSMEANKPRRSPRRSPRRKRAPCRRDRRRRPRRPPPLRLDDAICLLVGKARGLLMTAELYVSNVPSLVGSLALAWVSMGVDWFKWYEETFDACRPVDYHSPACTFGEFPGCFDCDTSRDDYWFVLRFHYLCSAVAFFLSSLFIGKVLIAFPVVRDELANPTTAAPLGLVCMAFEKVFAGHGYVGECITVATVALHTAVAIWFIFISVVYKTLPEPSWFSNTTGIGLAAIKLYLYWTDGGYYLCGLSFLALVLIYFVSFYRIHTNDKISAPVCWVQLSGPAVVLYGFTIFAQPGSDEDEYALLINEKKEHFFRVHREYYVPVLNALFVLLIVSMASSLYLLRKKWKAFREREFSPAHVIFACPTVAYTNTLQAYRSSFLKYSLSPPGTPFKIWLYCYWVVCLTVGSVLVFYLTIKFFLYLPSWCQIDVEKDEIPPSLEDSIIFPLLQKGEVADEMSQDFVSAAVLQANESGQLIRIMKDGKMEYVRSRRIPSVGFDPIMNLEELKSERDRLMHYRQSSFNESNHWNASLRRRSLNFLSFDASTMMRH